MLERAGLRHFDAQTGAALLPPASAAQMVGRCQALAASSPTGSSCAASSSRMALDQYSLDADDETP
jgi:hypothetical protein